MRCSHAQFVTFGYFQSAYVMSDWGAWLCATTCKLTSLSRVSCIWRLSFDIRELSLHTPELVDKLVSLRAGATTKPPLCPRLTSISCTWLSACIYLHRTAVSAVFFSGVPPRVEKRYRETILAAPLVRSTFAHLIRGRAPFQFRVVPLSQTSKCNKRWRRCGRSISI